MKIVRIYTGDDGRSHFEDRTVEARRNLMIPLAESVDISSWRRPPDARP